MQNECIAFGMAHDTIESSLVFNPNKKNNIIIRFLFDYIFLVI